MSVYETELPGVGRKFDLELSDGTVASVVIHHDGRCELYRRDAGASDGEKCLDMTGEEANKLGSLLEGAYFESVSVEELSVPLGDAIIEWVELPAESPVVGRLAETGIRQETGATIIAVQRGTETTPNPAPEFEVEAGDVLVSIGTREEQAALRELVEGNA